MRSIIGVAFARGDGTFVAWLTSTCCRTAAEMFKSRARELRGLPQRRDRVRDRGGRLLLRRDALHQGQGEVLPERGARGRPPTSRCSQEIRDLLAAGSKAPDADPPKLSDGDPVSRGAAGPAPAASSSRRGVGRAVGRRRPARRESSRGARRRTPRRAACALPVGLARRAEPRGSVPCAGRSCAESAAVLASVAGVAVSAAPTATRRATARPDPDGSGSEPGRPGGVDGVTGEPLGQRLVGGDRAQTSSACGRPRDPTPVAVAGRTPTAW